MKKTTYYLIFLTLLSCSLIASKGVFRTDERMILHLANNIDEFNALADSRELCNEDFDEYSSDPNYPVYCDEIKKKLKLLEIHYVSFEKNTNTGVKIVERMKLVTYKLDRNGLFNSYEKGYYIYLNNDTPALWEGNLDTKPTVEDCDNYHRIVKVNHESIDSRWFIYADAFCD